MRNLLSILLVMCLTVQVQAQRVGDPGVKFLSNSQLDPDYKSKMIKWKTAGVQNGIPFRSAGNTFKTISATNTDGLQAVINQAYQEGTKTKKIQKIFLKSGTYNINKTLLMKARVRLIGNSRTGVVLSVTMRGTSGTAIEFPNGVFRAGLDKLTIKGSAGTPQPFNMRNAKPNFVVSSVGFKPDAVNCWLDGVTIRNSGNHPVTMWRSKHLTFRDCVFDGAWNKGAGGRGYVNQQGSYCLYFNNTFKNLRHFGIHNKYAEYNVVYKNTIFQDVNFHNNDKGNNLIERNTITMPSGIGSNWHCIMGPWSKSKHKISQRNNFIYRNSCTEKNGSVRGKHPWSNPNKVYTGAKRYEQDGNPFWGNNNVPTNNKLYPLASGNARVSLEEESEQDPLVSINVFPNPVEDNQLYIRGLEMVDTKISLINMSGKQIVRWNLSGEQEQLLTIDEKVSTGYYLIKIENDRQSLTKRLMIQR